MVNILNKFLVCIFCSTFWSRLFKVHVLRAEVWATKKQGQRTDSHKWPTIRPVRSNVTISHAWSHPACGPPKPTPKTVSDLAKNASCSDVDIIREGKPKSFRSRQVLAATQSTERTSIQRTHAGLISSPRKRPRSRDDIPPRVKKSASRRDF